MADRLIAGGGHQLLYLEVRHLHRAVGSKLLGRLHGVVRVLPVHVIVLVICVVK